MSEMQPQLSDMQMSDEIDLKELFQVLWSGRLIIVAISSVAAVASIVISLMLPNVYTANALLAPAEPGGGMSALMQQYGGLASLGGFNTGRRGRITSPTRNSAHEVACLYCRFC